MGVSISILSITSAAFFYNDYETHKQNIRNNLVTKATFIGANVSSALLSGDQRVAQAALEIAKFDEGILLGVLYDADQVLAATFARPGYMHYLPPALPSEGVVFHDKTASILHPVALHDQSRGWLYLLYDLSELTASHNRYTLIVLAVLFVGLLIAWAMSSVSQKFITEPIIQLAGLVEKIRRTKDYNERLYVDRGDEIGVLIKGFNNMLATIQDRESELQRHGERLESLVELRTRQLHHRANYDALTQLPNRYLLMEKLHQAIESARRAECCMALLLIDLDRFKIINDSLGHHVGDELLQTLAKRLSRISRIDDCVGRFGGDEFVILLSNINGVEDAELVAHKVMAEFAEPFQLQHHRLHMSASIGISVFPRDADDAVGLLRRADISMYRSKANGQGTYLFYDNSMDNTDERLMLENRLRHALQNNELYMIYQPQISTKTNKVCGVEALMRWYNPELGEIFPTQFMSVAEEIGLINQLSDWAIGKICKQHKQWQQQGAPDIKVAVNVSASDLLTSDFVLRVKKNLAKYDMDPAFLELEITEDVFLDRTEQI
ncbi:MAG TPA: diguanylate cyclase, partial [Gammaproteobacteria bacterium]